MIYKKYDWYNLFPKSHQTESVFLRDVATPFLVYADDRNRTHFYENFIAVYHNINVELLPEIVEILDNLYFVFSCECVNCLQDNLGVDPDQGAYSIIVSSVRRIAALIKIDSYEQRMVQVSGVCGAFKEDYRATVAALVANHKSLDQAEKDLLYWHGIVPDDLMQDALVVVSYTYLIHLLGKRLK